MIFLKNMYFLYNIKKLCKYFKKFNENKDIIQKYF